MLTKRALLLILVPLVAVAGLTISLWPAHAAELSPDSMAVVATVNGQAVPVREFELFLGDDRATAYSHFESDGQGIGTASFWTTDFGGTTPARYLDKLALADAVRTSVQQRLAQRYGVTAPASYAAFLAGWQRQNAARAAALARHQVVYGPTRYTEASYFTTVNAQLIPELQSALVRAGAITVTTAALQRYYSGHLAQFSQPGQMGPVGFAALRSVVQEYYVQYRYEQLLGQLVAKASVHVNGTVLSHVPLD